MEPTLGDILEAALNGQSANDRYFTIRNMFLITYSQEIRELLDYLMEMDQAKIRVIKAFRNDMGLSLTEAKVFYEERRQRLVEYREAGNNL